MSRSPLLVRLLVIRQGSQWLAQGVDYNLATQAPSKETALKSFVRIVRAHLRRDAELGHAPFFAVPEAPQHFVDLWNRLDAENRIREVEPVNEFDSGTSGIPPAYVLQAITECGTDLTR